LSKRSFLLNNPYFNAIRNIKSVLDPDQKRRGLYMIGLLLLNATSDLLGLATIAFLIISALEEDIFSAVEYTREMVDSDFQYYIHSGLRSLYSFSGATDVIPFLFYLSIVIFVVFLIKNAIFIYITYIQTRFVYNVSLRLNKKMFKYFYDQGYLFIKHSTSGKKVYSIVDIPMRFASNYFLQVLTFTTELVVLIILGLALLLVDPIAVALITVIIIPVFMLIYAFSKNKIKEIGNVRNNLAPLNYAKVFEAMNGYVDIKLSNTENRISRGYEQMQRKMNQADTLFFGVYQRINSRTNDIIFGLGIMVIFGYAYFIDLNIDEVLQLLGIFAIAAYKFLPSVNRMMGGLLTMKNSSFVMDELKVVANTSLEEFPFAPPLEFKDNIELKSIAYQYPEGEDNVLNNVSIKIKKGTSVGFIGISGSGKTTLLKILLRLLKEKNGSLEIDGIKISTQNENSYQKIIGYVEQEIFILSDTILSNIAFGVDEPNLSKVKESLKDAQLVDFVNSHPEGLKMKLGENGVNLSGGQKQRIGIARALYKNSEILIFDEATSALDSETERAVVESINHLSNIGKTVVIVAHRLTTLEKCDYIYELEQGKVIAEHKYSQLILERVLQQ
jgi:ABC-type multidrug transport system fused ATPase/permease subunit